MGFIPIKIISNIKRLGSELILWPIHRCIPSKSWYQLQPPLLLILTLRMVPQLLKIILLLINQIIERIIHYFFISTSLPKFPRKRLWDGFFNMCFLSIWVGLVILCDEGRLSMDCRWDWGLVLGSGWRKFEEDVSSVRIDLIQVSGGGCLVVGLDLFWSRFKCLFVCLLPCFYHEIIFITAGISNFFPLLNTFWYSWWVHSLTNPTWFKPDCSGFKYDRSFSDNFNPAPFLTWYFWFIHLYF